MVFMNKINGEILSHISYFILSFLLLTLWLLKENGEKYYLSWSVVNFLSIAFLLTFGRRHYRSIKEVYRKNALEEDAEYYIFLVYLPCFNTFCAGLIVIDFVYTKIKSIK